MILIFMLVLALVAWMDASVNQPIDYECYCGVCGACEWDSQNFLYVGEPAGEDL